MRRFKIDTYASCYTCTTCPLHIPPISHISAIPPSSKPIILTIGGCLLQGTPVGSAASGTSAVLPINAADPHNAKEPWSARPPTPPMAAAVESQRLKASDVLRGVILAKLNDQKSNTLYERFTKKRMIYKNTHRRLRGFWSESNSSIRNISNGRQNSIQIYSIRCHSTFQRSKQSIRHVARKGVMLRHWNWSYENWIADPGVLYIAQAPSWGKGSGKNMYNSKHRRSMEGMFPARFAWHASVVAVCDTSCAFVSEKSWKRANYPAKTLKDFRKYEKKWRNLVVEAKEELKGDTPHEVYSGASSNFV